MKKCEEPNKGSYSRFSFLPACLDKLRILVIDRSGALHNNSDLRLRLGTSALKQVFASGEWHSVVNARNLMSPLHRPNASFSSHDSFLLYMHLLSHKRACFRDWREEEIADELRLAVFHTLDEIPAHVITVLLQEAQYCVRHLHQQK